MKKERKIAFNTNHIFFFVLFLIFIGLAIFFLTDNEDGDIILAIAGFAMAVAPIFAIVISPVIYIFDDDQLTIVYCLGIKEVISWKGIRSITKRGGWFKGTGRGMPVYEIAYPNKKKIPFFVEACVAHNKKTAKLMKEYYKKNIVEY
ncbi:MAG: hypothetical protein E7636_05910 [Ruminococcaceae bacterium]|nr:hypothetical protein [Oscillospiraceae bacterium]